jgi:caffeoyl-CoA O-methyltransferase
LYKGSSDIVEKTYAMAASVSDISNGHDFAFYESEIFPQTEMGSSPLLIKILTQLIRILKPKVALEIGTFTGVTSIAMAKAMPDGGHLYTIEKFDKFSRVAKKNIDGNGMSDKITLLEGDAFEIMSALRGVTLDFVFIDGNKERYLDFFQLADKMLSKNGVVVIDDVLFHGDVLNEVPTTEKGAGVVALLNHISSMQNYSKLFLPIINGILIAYKL